MKNSKNNEFMESFNKVHRSIYHMTKLMYFIEAQSDYLHELLNLEDITDDLIKENIMVHVEYFLKNSDNCAKLTLSTRGQLNSLMEIDVESEEPDSQKVENIRNCNALTALSAKKQAILILDRFLEKMQQSEEYIKALNNVELTF